MNRLAACVAVALSLLALPLAAEQPLADRATLENDVVVLADDTMQGRAAGTDGYAMAADYVAGRFAELGLQPGGDDGQWFQNVPLVRVAAARETRMLIVDGTGNISKADFRTDFVGRGAPITESGIIDAPIVFVGYGLDLPEQGYDDLGTVNLRGAIALWVPGVPEGIDSEQAAHLQLNADARFAAHGAIGSMMLWTSGFGQYNFWAEAGPHSPDGTTVTWLGKDGVPHSDAAGLQVSLTASPGLSNQLLAGQRINYQQLIASQADGPAPLPSFRTGLTARISYENSFEMFDTANVIAVQPGTDPAVADEYVVVTAHLDHIGVSDERRADGDTINNGAMDNATGVAAMLEIARLLKAAPSRRPVMFVALGAEEIGLLGSSYHAANPGLATGELVANVNFDMPILTWPFNDIVAFGGERSNMRAAVQSAATEYGVRLSPDPNPQEMFFVRSDQYSYVQQGIPAVYLDLGFGNGGEAEQTYFLRAHYHKVSDEIARVDFEQLGRFADIGYLATRNIANMAQRPAWVPGDFFGRTYGGVFAQQK